MRERSHHLVVRVDEKEQAMMRALAEDADQHASQLIRRWISQHYAARFGDTSPPHLPKRAPRPGELEPEEA